MRRIAITAVAGLAVLGFTACSPDENDFADEAADFIDDDEGEVATALNVTFEDVECQEPANTDEGTTFTCTASGSDGNNYSFVNEVTGDRAFEVVDYTTDGAAPTGTGTPTATTSG